MTSFDDPPTAVELGLDTLLAHTAEGVVVWGRASSRIVVWSEAAEAVLGYSARETLGRPVQDIMASLCSDAADLQGRVSVERPVRHKNGRELQLECTLSLLHGGASRGDYVVALLRDASERSSLRVQAAAVQHVARKLAAEASHEHVLDDLLEEAVTAVRGDAATVYRWDDSLGRLVVVRNTVRTSGEHVPSGQGAVGRAVEQRAPVIVNDYQRTPGMVQSTARVGVQAAMGVPLLHEGRLLGALGVVTYAVHRSFGDDDAQLLELLASVAAAVLVGLERARLEGAVLAARTTAHELGNTLAALVAQVQVLRRDPRFHPGLVARADVVVEKAHEAAAKMQRLQNMQTLRETRWGSGTTTIQL